MTDFVATVRGDTAQLEELHSALQGESRVVINKVLIIIKTITGSSTMSIQELNDTYGSDRITFATNIPVKTANS